MPDATADRVATVLAESMQELRGAERALALAAYRLLAKGSPASADDLSEEAGVGLEETERWLEEVPGVFRDERGRIVGFWGLALGEMPHRFAVGGAQLYAWCAWDTLFMPALIGRPARVSSSCQQTGEELTFKVDAEGVSELSHSGAVLSMLAPESGFDADVITAFCHHVHFFVSSDAGERWLAAREGDDAFLLTISEAHRLGRLWNGHRFGMAVAA